MCKDHTQSAHTDSLCLQDEAQGPHSSEQRLIPTKHLVQCFQAVHRESVTCYMMPKRPGWDKFMESLVRAELRLATLITMSYKSGSQVALYT